MHGRFNGCDLKKEIVVMEDKPWRSKIVNEEEKRLQIRSPKGRTMDTNTIDMANSYLKKVPRLVL